MIKGIAIVGLNGAGKSTLAHALAKESDYFEMDVEDYYYPGQKAARQDVLEGQSMPSTEVNDVIPYSVSKRKDQVQEALLRDIKIHKKFVITGVTMNWCQEILSCIDVIFWVKTPTEKRLERIQGREKRRFGDRVSEGGDMYLQQVQFQKHALSKDLKDIEKSIEGIHCSVIELDGMLSVAESLKVVKKYLSANS